MDDTPTAGVVRTKPPKQRAELSNRLSLDRFVPYRLSVLSNTVSRSIARIYSDRHGLAIPDWRVMAVLGIEAPLSAREVCAHTAMDKVQVSRAVGRLIDRGLVIRETSESDRRRSVLSLSVPGKTMYAEIVPLARAAEATLLEGLSRTEIQQLEHLLQRLHVRASALFGPEGPDLESPND